MGAGEEKVPIKKKKGEGAVVGATHVIVAIDRAFPSSRSTVESELGFKISVSSPLRLIQVNNG